MPTIRSTVYALIGLVVLAGAAQAAQPSFYLATDRIFSSAEDAVVRVEGREIDQISLRVYRITDPLAFFSGQDNPYQVRPEGTRVPGIRQLTGIFLAGVRRDVAETLKSKIAHKALPEKLRKDVKKLLQVREYTGTIESRGYLKDYQLVREIKTDLDMAEEGWSYHLIKLPVFERGVYLIEGVVGNETGYCVAMVSDLAVISRHADDKAVFFVTDRMTGKPQAARITLFRKGEGSMRVNADANGLAGHSEKRWLDGRSWMLAEGPGGVALHDVTYYPTSSFGVRSTKCYIYTERPMYKPGQKVLYKAVVREYEAGYKTVSLENTRVPVEIMAPSGKMFSKTSGTAGLWGTVSGDWEIPENAEPGIWKLVVVHEGRRHEAPFKIEHYVKPPFEVTVSTEKPSFSFGEQVKGKISARYFFGEAVRDATVQYFVYRVERVRSWHVGVPFGWYLQDNEYRNTREEMVYEGKGQTDREGVCAFEFNANTKNLKGEAYTYRIEARISDRSRRLVRGSKSFDVVQGQFWLQLGLSKEYFTPGEKATMAVAAFGYDGKPVTPDYQARILYYRWNSAYMSRPAEKVVRFDKRLELPDQASFSYTFQEPGHYQIELTAKDSAGNTITTHQFVWVAGNANNFIVQETGLRIVADKKIYGMGETAELLMLSPVPGMRVLYTIEGDTILESGVLNMSGNSVIRKQRITDRMMPNAWLVLHFVYKDRVYTARQQLVVPPKEKFLAITLDGVKERYRPGDQVTGTIKVKDHRGRGVEASLSLGVVDQAIYFLQPKMVADIERFFYHPHRSNVLGASSFHTRFYGYAEEDKLHLARHLRGDMTLADMSKGAGKRTFDESKRSDFRDVAYWNAEIKTDGDGIGRFSFKLPDNITQWTMELVAVDEGERVGSTRQQFISRKEFFVRPVVPQYLYERDAVVLAATVHNLHAVEKQGSVTLRVRNGTIESDATLSVSVPANGEKLVTWKVRAPETGSLETEFSLTGPDADTEVQKISVQAFARSQFKHWSGPLNDSKTVTEDFDLPQGARLADAAGRIRVSPSLINLVEDSLKYLVGYPYGCVEQTLSSFVPNLLVMKMQGDMPFKDEYLKSIMPELTTTGIDRLQAMQNQDGSWGWFAGDKSDIFMTAYAVYSLSMARDLGYREQVTLMLSRGADFLSGYLRRENRIDPVSRALALFALREYRPNSNEYLTMLRTALNETPADNRLARALLANTVIGTSLQYEARNIVAQQLRARQITQGEVGESLYTDDRPHASSWHQDNNLVDALLLRALAKTRQQQDVCKKLINGLLERRQESGWRSTVDTAFVLTAFVEYSKTWQNRADSEDAVVHLNGRKLELVKSGLGAEAIVPPGLLKTGKNTLEIKGEDGLYYSAGVRYHARQESFAAQGNSISVTRSWYGIEKNRDGLYVISEELKGELPKGKLVLVRLDVRTDRNVDYVMLEDPLPAGCEFVRESDPNFVQGVKLNNWLSHQVLADKVVFFNRYLLAPEMTVWYLVRPYLDGTYHVLPAAVGSMYYPEYSATGASSVITIEKP
ncbi:MAG TPA: MG2 domain-containing protein [Spirochaetota bacterium]|nr:MG2 domain-containing protein [Spirochaetota bacterium]